MVENPKSDSAPIAAPSFRFATADDIAVIDELDSFSTSPTRDIHREMEKYFGSVDPSPHERTLIFLAEVEGSTEPKYFSISRWISRVGEVLKLSSSSITAI